MEDIKSLEPSLTWFGHASFSFVDKSGNRVYYVDPFDLTFQPLEKADLIFITHAHPDHFSQKDIDKIIKEDTVIIAPPDILEKIGIEADRKVAVEPNKSYDTKGFKFSTIPAYNNHPEKLQIHPKANNWVGYIFELNGKKIYHAGDTDFIEEMKALKDLNLEIAMLPMDSHYTMTVEEAANAANAISAQITVPMHYRRQNPDSYKDMEENFKKLVTNSKVVILEELR
jgi:L-ascorbate metabolism protein UlaG (beta-lactamase superfamily)